MMMRNMRSLAIRGGIVAAMALVTGCGEYPTNDAESADTRLQLDRVERRIRALSSTDTGLSGAPKLQPQEASGDTPANLIAADKVLPTSAALEFEGNYEDAFGAAVAVSNDTVAVGSPDRDDIGGNSGAVYIFRKDSGAWVFSQKLLAKDGNLNDNFGFSLAIEGDRLVVGARRAASTGGLETGAVYIYNRLDGKTWTLSDKLTPPGGGYEDFFGYAVALSGDTILIGAPQADVGGLETGAAYVYTYNGTAWQLDRKLTPIGGDQNDFYGGAVALLRETPVFGPTALVSAWNDSDNPGYDDGAVYTYVNPDPNTQQPWGLHAKLVASDQTPGDTFGFSLATYGQTAFIGAPLRGRDCDYAGAVYVFGRHSGIWCEEAIIVPEDKNAGMLFGYSEALFGDAAIIGAAYDDDAGDFSGSAYVYNYKEGDWVQKSKFVPGDAAPAQLVGYATAMDGDQVAVSALSDTYNGINSGSTYLFSVLDDPGTPTTLVADSNGNAQCSMRPQTAFNQSAWFIGLGFAAFAMRRGSRKTKRA